MRAFSPRCKIAARAFALLAAFACLPAFSLPRDAGAHPGARSEWWRYTGLLNAPGERRYAYVLTFFRSRTYVVAGSRRSAWDAAQIYAATFQLVDETGRRVRSARRSGRGTLDFARASETSPDVRVATWRAAGRAPTRLSASDRDDGIALELAASSRAFETPFGYAISRVPTRGTIRLDGSTSSVAGTSLVEHAYGFRLPADASGWDSFALQLSDGRDFYVLTIRRRDGRPAKTFTVVVDRRGVARRPPAGDVSAGVHLDTHWRSPRTNARYPSLWGFDALREGLRSIELAPVAYDQEIAGDRGRASYWDGAIDAYDDNPGGGHIGIGFVQLTGYAGAIAP